MSYWLLQPPDGCVIQVLEPFPVVSALGKAMAKPRTYYRAGTASVFQTATHAAIMEVVDDIASATHGVRGLIEGERKPAI